MVDVINHINTYLIENFLYQYNEIKVQTRIKLKLNPNQNNILDRWNLLNYYSKTLITIKTHIKIKT